MAAQKWSFDPSHSSIGFSVRHLMVSKVHGRFGQWRGTLEIDEKDPGRSRVEVEIDASSIDTQDPKRDEHLRSADFLEVEKHPVIRFKSRSAARDGEGLKLVGDLTVRGVTRQVELAVEDSGRVKDPWGGERAGFSARTTIQRKHFGLTWNLLLEAGGAVLGDKVEVTIEIEAIKVVAPSAKPLQASA